MHSYPRLKPGARSLRPAQKRTLSWPLVRTIIFGQIYLLTEYDLVRTLSRTALHKLLSIQILFGGAFSRSYKEAFFSGLFQEFGAPYQFLLACFDIMCEIAVESCRKWALSEKLYADTYVGTS